MERGHPEGPYSIALVMKMVLSKRKESLFPIPKLVQNNILVLTSATISLNITINTRWPLLEYLKFISRLILVKYVT